MLNIKKKIEERKARKQLKEQTLQLQFLLLSKLYSLVKVVSGDVDIESILSLAEQLKGLNNKELVHELVNRIKDEVEEEYGEELADKEDGEEDGR